MVNMRTVSCMLMTILAAAVCIGLLVAWLMDKPLHFKKIDALNTDVENAIEDIKVNVALINLAREETRKLEEQEQNR